MLNHSSIREETLGCAVKHHNHSMQQSGICAYIFQEVFVGVAPYDGMYHVLAKDTCVFKAKATQHVSSGWPEYLGFLTR